MALIKCIFPSKWQLHVEAQLIPHPFEEALELFFHEPLFNV